MYIPPSRPPTRSKRPNAILLVVLLVASALVAPGAGASGPDGVPIVGDWNGNGHTSVGWYHDGEVFLRNANSAGTADAHFSFGRSGDIPIVGDWNGDGRDTIGVIRGSRWLLRNENTSGPADHAFVYGRVSAGDWPVAGDWNGDGHDGIGVVRNGSWNLRNSPSGGRADLVFDFGDASGDIPVVGDWNGDGRDTPAVVRNGTWHLRNDNRGGAADHVFTFQLRSDVPIAGDWNSHGRDGPGVVRGHRWYLRMALTDGDADHDFTFQPGPAEDAGSDSDGDPDTSDSSSPDEGSEHHGPEPDSGHDTPDDTDSGDGAHHDEHDGHESDSGSIPETSSDVDADVVLSGDYPDGFVVGEGQTAVVEGLVTTPENVVVHGTLVMRPGAHLKFRDVDMTNYVGATDQHDQPVVDSDVGLWVMGQGVLDLAGTPKRGWNRTGEHATWQADDEYWISPTEPGDYDPRRWEPGDPIPQYDPRVPPAEVMNVTRDVVIEGPAHIHIHSNKPQRIEYVQLRAMGVSNKDHEGPVLGRYALHFHHGMDGTRGTIVRGVAAIDSRGRVFVPHMSHGITFEDVVSVNSYAEALWWDKGDMTHDVLVDRLAASGVHMPEHVAGKRRNIPVVVLKSNENAEIRDSAVSGSRGRAGAQGFHWNTKGAHRFETRAVWNFHDNVTHNNEGNGLRFWFNDKWAHHVRDTAIYNNGGVGIENGAYTNSIRYSDVLVLNNKSGGIMHHSSSNEQAEDGGPSRYTRVTVEGPSPALKVGKLTGTPKTRQEFIDCDLGGSPRVLLDDNDKTKEPFIALFRECGSLTPDDIVFGGSGITSAMDGTSIIIEHPDGSKWEITVKDSNKIVKEM